MTVAAVMGAIDYKTAKQKGVFKNLYKEEKPVVANNKEVDFEDYSRGKIQDVQVKEEPIKTKKIKNKSKSMETVSYTPPVVSKQEDALQLDISSSKRIRKGSLGSFSRAALPIKVVNEPRVKEAVTDTASTVEN